MFFDLQFVQFFFIMPLSPFVIMPFMFVDFGDFSNISTFWDIRYFLSLKDLFHPACLARIVSWFAFGFVSFMAHENGGRKGHSKDDTCKECWT